jgi:hypothetical protein
LVAWSLLGLWRRLMLAMDPRWLYLDLRLLSSGQGARARQPYAVAMKDHTPFAIAGLWENSCSPCFGLRIPLF